MDVPKNTSEGVPLNSGANIFFGKNTKVSSKDGTVIQLNTKDSGSAEVGVHINTTLAIASSKKIRLLFLLNFLLSVVCMIISSSVAFYYWNEMVSMRRQIDTIKDHVLLQSIKNVNRDKTEVSALVGLKPEQDVDVREPRMRVPKEMSQNGRKYYVKDLGEDIHFVDIKKESVGNIERAPPSTYAVPAPRKDLTIIHFNGGLRETILPANSYIGPWVRDVDISSNNSEQQIELNSNIFTVKESGVYMIYSQVVYLATKPNCYYIFAQQPGGAARHLATCATGADPSDRPADRSQISCGAHAVARLRTGDAVNLVQREANRTLWLRPGYAHVGFIKLAA